MLKITLENFFFGMHIKKECHADRGIYYAKLHVEYDLILSTAEQLTATDLKTYIEAHTKK